MIKYDFDATASYTGGVDGPRGDEPARSPASRSKDNTAAVTAYDSYTATAVATRSPRRVEKAVPGAEDRHDVPRRPTAASPAQVPANQIAALLKVAGVAAVQKDTLEPAARRQHRVHRRDERVADARRLGQRRHRTSSSAIIDTGVWPEHPMLVAGGRLGAPRRRPQGAAQFGDGTDAAHLGPTFTLQQQADRRVRQDRHVHGEHRLGRPGVLQQHDARVLAARLRGSRHAHDDDGRRRLRRPRRVLYGVERGPVCGIAPGARVIEYRVCLVERLLQLRLGRGRPAGDPRRRQRDQLLDLGRRATRTPIRSSSRSSTRSTPGSRSTPRPATAARAPATSDHGGPWVTTVGASTGPRSFTSTLHLTADGGATFDMLGRHADQRHLDARRPSCWPQTLPGRGRALPVDARRGHGDRQDRRSASAAPTAASTRAAGSSPAARPG